MPAPTAVQPVNLDFASVAVPGGDGKELEDGMEVDAATRDAKRKLEDDEGPIPSIERLSAMADVCMAQGESKSKEEEGSSAKKGKGKGAA